MAKNIGTLVSSAIRPNDSLDPIATAFSNEIKGGLHNSDTLTDRNSIIFERREWGMLCYVIDQNTTYQLIYNRNSTDIMDNSNWGLFEANSASGEWLASVLSIEYNQPLNPIDGDRYLLGITLGDSVTGVDWVNITPTSVVEWKADLGVWNVTEPTDGTSVRIDDEDNSIYRFEGSFPGGFWTKERINQVSDIIANSSDSLNYTASSPVLKESYIKDMIFLVKFNQANIDTQPTININGLGPKIIKKTGISGVANLLPNELQLDNIYTMVYDGVNFQIQNSKSDGSVNVKYYIEPNDYIVVPPFHQYWVYDNLTIAGTLINYGQVVIANGSLEMVSGGTFSNFGQLILVNLDMGMADSLVFIDTDTIQFGSTFSLTQREITAQVKDGSITSDKLNVVNGGATASYVLSSNGDGSFSWVENNDFDNESAYEVFNSNTTISNNQPTGATLTNTPKDYSTVKVFVNGSLQVYGNGVTTGVVCYFSNDGGSTAVSFEEIQIGSELYWNGDIAGYDLDFSDLIVIVYEY
jgi:hypothetical protein